MQKETRDLENSRPMDVHRWSDHPEVNALVDELYDDLFKSKGKGEIKKKHLKVVLLDLYISWATDPDSSVRISRNVNDYKAKSRYNSLHISKLTIEVIDVLLQEDLINQEKGFNDRSTGIGRLTRVWPAKALIRLFMRVKFGPLDITEHNERETIVLRNEERENIEYRDKKNVTVGMRQLVNRYNQLLSRTFIDIPELETPLIDVKDPSTEKLARLHVSQSEKFIQRIFNRADETFTKGGRFYGGWWQRCPKEWRKKIFINDAPTNEVDYSGLHIVLLYAQNGIDYWEAFGVDPYQIPKPEFLQSDEQTREYAKKLVLMAVNASSDNKAFEAFRDEASTGSIAKSLKNKQLRMLLTSLREKHKPIAHCLGADAGIDLMNLDSRITERIVQHFVSQGIPILAIHDSYIVPFGEEEHLEEMMTKAFMEFTGKGGIRVKSIKPRYSEVFHSLQGPEPSLVNLPKFILHMKRRFPSIKARLAEFLRPTPRSSGYKNRHAQFKNWLTAVANTQSSL